MLCGSGLEVCRICMQKKKNLCAQFCRPVAAKEASEEFWIMIELVWFRFCGITWGNPSLPHNMRASKVCASVLGYTFTLFQTSSWQGFFLSFLSL